MCRANNVIIKCLLLFLFSVSFISAQQASNSDYYMGKTDGERDAKGNVMWVAAGCLPPWGNIAAYLIKPSPPAYAFIGKSPLYIKGYTEGYKEKAALKNLGYSCLGTGMMVGCVFIVAVSAEKNNGCDLDPCKPCNDDIEECNDSWDGCMDTKESCDNCAGGGGSSSLVSSLISQL